MLSCQYCRRKVPSYVADRAFLQSIFGMLIVAVKLDWVDHIHAWEVEIRDFEVFCLVDNGSDADSELKDLGPGLLEHFGC